MIKSGLLWPWKQFALETQRFCRLFGFSTPDCTRSFAIEFLSWCKRQRARSTINQCQLTQQIYFWPHFGSFKRSGFRNDKFIWSCERKVHWYVTLEDLGFYVPFVHLGLWISQSMVMPSYRRESRYQELWLRTIYWKLVKKLQVEKQSQTTFCCLKSTSECSNWPPSDVFFRMYVLFFAEQRPSWRSRSLGLRGQNRTFFFET